MVVSDEIRRLRWTAVVLTQEPEQGNPLPPDNAVTVTVAIPIVPPVAVAIVGAGVVFAGVGYTIREKIGKNGNRVKEKPGEEKPEKRREGRSEGHRV
jgi:hypothetical protein